ncbi:MAG: hypothetical protein J0I41_12305 [Filimonas sp.]|nr:hypothetical protein [Filimonas sp.]
MKSGKKNFPTTKMQKRKKAREVIKGLQKGIIPSNINRNFLYQNIKYSLSPIEADLVLENIEDELYNYIIGNPITDQYSEISNYNVYPQKSGIEKEVLWVEKFLKDYNPEINSFLKLEAEFENLFLLGKYEEAERILDQVDKTITKSLWSIQSRLYVGEFKGGFQENKKILSDVLEQGVGALLGAIINFISIRIEKNISPSQYNGILQAYIDKQQECLHGYFNTKLDFFAHNDDNKPAGMLLALDGTMSIIDRYKGFIQAAQLILTTNLYSEKEQLKTIRVIRDLITLIDDVDLDNLLALVDGCHNRQETDSYLSMLNNYTSGNYEQSLKYAARIIRFNVRSFSAIYIYSRSLCYLQIAPVETFGEKESIVDSLITCLVSLFNRDENYEISLSSAFSIAQALGFHPLAVNIYNLLTELLPYRIGMVNNIDFEKLAMLNSKFINPALYSHIHLSKRELFLRSFVSNYTTSSVICLIDRIFKGITTPEEYDSLSFRELKYIGLRYMGLNDYTNALNVFDYIINEERFQPELKLNHVRVDVASAKFRTLIKLEQLVDALEFCVDTLIDVPNFQNHFFNPDFISQLISSEDSRVSDNVCLSVLLKIYELDVDNYHIYVGYDNFLCSLNCDTPKDFLEHVEIKNKRQVAFLDKVCRHEVLYSSPFFRDQDEMDLARIEICNFLGSKLENYSNGAEVSELLRKVVVRKGIKQIDYSKIYVDIKGVKNALNKELRENFLRNVEIASLSIEQLTKLEGSVEKLFVYYFDDNYQPDEKNEHEENKEEILKNIKLTSYDRFLHFTEAFLKIRDLFLFSADNGLNTYLSMRIRHGTLPGQIRSVFEAARLITSWSEADQSYLPNEYILLRYALAEDDREKLNKAFNNFSKQIDEISEKLKTQIIQISTEAKPSKGLFNYSYGEKSLLTIFQHKLGSVKDFDLFVEGVIAELWDRTEDNLQEIRNYLSTETTKEFDRIFDTLETSMNRIDSLKNYINISTNQEIVAELRDCRTAIIVEVQKISEWFRRSNKKYLDAFDFSILLDSSVQALIRSFLGTSIKIDNQCNLQIDGDYFPHFTDIVFYLLHNALKHSHVSPNELQIFIKVANTDDRIIIEVKNNLANDENYVSYCRNRAVEVKKALLDQSKLKNAYSGEGGTGFPKIMKALTQNLARNDEKIELLVEEETTDFWFKTVISFGFDGILKQKNDESFNN